MENPTAKIVEGSNGLLLEIDGQIVPNYDATMRPFEEGEVVTGHVVRIDHDEVLVDIGYKSEGVIPVAELSIRRSVNPADEVSLDSEIDFDDEQEEDQVPLDETEAAEAGVLLDDPEALSDEDE